MIGVTIAICIFGICVGYATIDGELEELTVPGRIEYSNHLKAYVETGNVWDPEDEEELRRKLKLEDAEGGENEERKLMVDIDDEDIDGKLPLP